MFPTQNLTPNLVAVQVSIPISSGNGSRLTTLLTNGTLITAAGDLPPSIAALDSGSRLAAIAKRVAACYIINNAASFQVGYDAAMTTPQVVTANQGWTTDVALDASRRTYLRSAAAAQNVIVKCCIFGSGFEETSDGA